MPMITWIERWLLVLVAIGAAAAGATLTAAVLVPHYRERIATMERDQAQAEADARSADVETLKLSKLHGDALTLRLQATESTLSKREKELRNAIASKTTGRACLSGDVVRLLNGTATDNATDLPAPAPVAAAADGPAATDTDVAQWISYAKGQYEVCRARLNALIDW